MQTEGTPSLPRRLVVCCDGTWDSADGGEAASNVVRIARSVKPIAANGMPQIVYYHPGVGTGNGLDKLIGGATGVGLARNVRDAYAFIVNNYVPGDEIFLFGFSRGAYTARSISGLIDTIGLLGERQMGGFLDAWAFYRMSSAEKRQHQAAFDAQFDGRQTDVSIKCIGVWDTVGSLGIPSNRIVGRLPICRANYKFLSVKLCPSVEYAFQALAIDEKRAAFPPSVWDRDPRAPATQVIRQVWFAGVHADIGGGYKEHGAADLSFLWMVAQTWDLLDFDADDIAAELDKSQAYEQATLHESATGIWRNVIGIKHRKLGTGVNEEVHPSAIRRLATKGSGPGGKNPYNPSQKKELEAMPVAALLPIEQKFSWIAPSPPSPNTEPLFKQSNSLCDGIVRWLGGG